MKRYCKALSILLALILTFSAFPLFAKATGFIEGTCGENVVWSFHEVSGKFYLRGQFHEDTVMLMTMLMQQGILMANGL